MQDMDSGSGSWQLAELSLLRTVQLGRLLAAAEGGWKFFGLQPRSHLCHPEHITGHSDEDA